jgi:acetylornithine deacetylase
LSLISSYYIICYIKKDKWDMELRHLITQIIEDNKSELIGFLSDLIRIPSVNLGEPNTGNEQAVQTFIASYLEKMGLDVAMKAYDEKRQRPNVLAHWHGKGGGESLLINAHADVVPINDPEKWTHEPFGGIVSEGRIWGRGAADDKQGIAAMVFAVKALQKAGVKLKGDVILLSSVGEESNEGGTLGAGRAMADELNKPTFAIVTESTGGTDLDIEGPSLFFFELIVNGKAVHIGDRNMAIYPQPRSIPCGNECGADALQKTLPILQMLYQKERDWALNWRDSIVGCGGLKTFDKKGVGVYSINICNIEGGTYLGSIPGKVRILGSVFHPQDYSSTDIFKQLKQHVLAVASTDSWLVSHPPQMQLLKNCHYWQGYKVLPDHPGVKAAERAYQNATGKPLNISGFKAVCDATYLQRVGIPSVVFGAGESGFGVHGVDESCSIELILRTCKFLASMILEWCNADK